MFVEDPFGLVTATRELADPTAHAEVEDALHDGMSDMELEAKFAALEGGRGAGPGGCEGCRRPGGREDLRHLLRLVPRAEGRRRRAPAACATSTCGAAARAR